MKRIFSLALVLLVVSSPITGLLGAAGPVGEATACNGMGIMVTEGCGPDNDPSNTEIDESQDHLALYQQGVSMMSMSKSYTDTMGNYVKDTEDIAWLMAERAVAQAYQNGANASEAKVAAKEAVKDYYAVRQMNTLNAWDNHMAALKSMKNQTSTFTDDPSEFVYITDGSFGLYNPSSSVEYGDADTGLRNFEVVTKNYTLINGSTVEGYQLKAVAHDRQYGNKRGDAYWDPLTNSITFQGSYAMDGDRRFGDINIRAPNAEYPQKAYMYKPRWTDVFNSIDSTYNEVASETDTFVNNTYDSFKSGEINSTDLLSRTNLMNHYMLDGTGNASFNDVVAALSAAGWSTTDLGNSSYMNITYEPNHLSNESITRQGMLLSGQAPPNETWTVGTQYESTDLNGTQAVATLDGDLHTINGTFAINAVYDSDGSEIEDVELTSPERTYKTTNTTELQRLVEQLGEDIDKLEDMKTDDSDAGAGVDASGFFSALGNALTGLFGFVGSGLTGAIQGLIIVAGALIALAILLNALMP